MRWNMRKIYSKPTLACCEMAIEDILAVSVGQITELQDGENELGNWWTC